MRRLTDLDSHDAAAIEAAVRDAQRRGFGPALEACEALADGLARAHQWHSQLRHNPAWPLVLGAIRAGDLGQLLAAPTLIKGALEASGVLDTLVSSVRARASREALVRNGVDVDVIADAVRDLERLAEICGPIPQWIETPDGADAPKIDPNQEDWIFALEGGDWELGETAGYRVSIYSHHRGNTPRNLFVGIDTSLAYSQEPIADLSGIEDYLRSPRAQTILAAIAVGHSRTYERGRALSCDALYRAREEITQDIRDIIEHSPRYAEPDIIFAYDHACSTYLQDTRKRWTIGEDLSLLEDAFLDSIYYDLIFDQDDLEACLSNALERWREGDWPLERNRRASVTKWTTLMDHDEAPALWDGVWEAVKAVEWAHEALAHLECAGSLTLTDSEAGEVEAILNSSAIDWRKAIDTED